MNHVDLPAQDPRESIEEYWARILVMRTLGVPVEFNDRNTAPSQVDHLVHDAVPPSPLEVVSDNDVAHLRQWNAFTKYGRQIRVPGLKPGMYVSVQHSADVRRLRQQLPSLLLTDGVAYLEAEFWEPIPQSLWELGVVYLGRLEEVDGIAHLAGEGWASWTHDAGSRGMDRWVDAVLAREHDVVDKLLAHKALRRHAFIWATSGSSMAISRLLRDDVADAGSLPPLSLPDGITDVWVASTLTGRQAVHWSRSGWEGVGPVSF